MPVNRASLSTLVLLSCGSAAQPGADSLEAALRSVQGVEVVDVSAQADEFTQARLFDATIQVRGRTLTLLALDPEHAVTAPLDTLILLSIDGLHPQCRLSSGEVEGGVNLPSDARTAELGIRSLVDVVSRVDDLYRTVSSAPRSEDAATASTAPDGSSRRCWIDPHT
jgi:hypothetical protein